MCLGFPVSSLEARHRQAQRVVSFIYVGIPVIFLGLVVWITAADGTEAYDWAVALVPLALLAGGWWRRGKSRYLPTRWPSAGALMGGVTAMFSPYFAMMLATGKAAFWFVPLGIAGAILGIGFGGYGFRALMSPAIPELAESPYELSFRIRGWTRLRLSIGADQVALHEQMVVQSAEGRDTTVRSKAYPFSAITGVYDVTLSGSERLKYPVTMKLPPTGTPGPALILQTQGEDWVLPQNEAPAIAQILSRRIAAARTH